MRRRLRRRYGRSSGGGWKRVGIAFTNPRGASGRRDEYGIYESPSRDAFGPLEPKLYAQYEGYREGDRMVGLPLAGPNAAHSQPKIDFVRSHFGEVRFFDGRRA